MNVTIPTEQESTVKRAKQRTKRDRKIDKLVEEAGRLRHLVPREVAAIRTMTDAALRAELLAPRVIDVGGDLQLSAVPKAQEDIGVAAAPIQVGTAVLHRAQAIAIVARVLPDLDDVDLAASAHALAAVANDTKQTPAVVADLLLTAQRAGAGGLTPSPNLARLLAALAADAEW